jgi:hypothetical protein
MSNNKQSGNQVPDVRKMVSSVEWYIIERHNIEIQSRLGKISSTQYDEQLIKIEEQAKAMHKEEVINATIYGDRFEGCYGLDSDQYYEKTFGGSNE